ncbi:MAG: hypothetical protein LBP32_01450 [Spirochaetaceae bacterium]|jgi:hypothetical protein|nr:hypothetical protein [Spirochaetaceae bacterium]
MKQSRIFITGMLLLPAMVFALDLTVVGGLGNMAFDTDRTGSLGAQNQAFQVNYFPFGQVRLAGDYSNFISFAAAFERDPVLRNRVTTDFGLNIGYFRLNVGPFMGPFNTREKIITPGLTAGLTLEIPGIFFGSIAAGSTIGTTLRTPGEYLQQTGEITLGFWLPHVISALSVNLRSFSEQEGGDLVIQDELVRYQFSAEVFTKNVPYTVHIDMGYQTLERSYSSAAQSDSDKLKSVFLGFESYVRLNPFVKLILGAEMPVYSWGEKPLRNPHTVIFQAHTGVLITFIRKIN